MSRNIRSLMSAIITTVAISMAVPSAAFSAQGRGHGNGRGNGHEKEKVVKVKDEKAVKAKAEERDDHPDYVTVRTRTAGDGAIINRYYVAEPLPPGLTRQPLPPGLRAQLRERGQLPPGLQKRLVPVPTTVVSRLTPLDPYYSRYFLGRDYVVMDTRNNVVAVIHTNVLR